MDTQTLFVWANDRIALDLEKSGTGNVSGSDLKTRQIWHLQSVDHHLAQEEISSGDLFWTLPEHVTARDETRFPLQTRFWCQGHLNGRVSVFNTVRDVLEYVSARVTPPPGIQRVLPPAWPTR
ncbi:MAG: hypothetical protein R6U98_30625 [Pirellulaceae bacterium]